jgi:hypothetical protein
VLLRLDNRNFRKKVRIESHCEDVYVAHFFGLVGWKYLNVATGEEPQLGEGIRSLDLLVNTFIDSYALTQDPNAS